VLASCEDETKLSIDLAALFKHQIRFEVSLVTILKLMCYLSSVEAPSEIARYELIRGLLSDTKIAPDISLRALALQTAAFSAVDLEFCVEQAKLFALERATQQKSVYQCLSKTEDYLIARADKI
jgi:hypothetical protein